ncbi:MAG TPA: aspartate aminotransferase family protein [Bacteroidales bacterium]|nr:aspartate aminotransferase family protein [Bacteroidales bacterium]
MESARSIFFRHIAQTSRSPLALEIDHASGMYLYGTDGKRYMDLISGISVSNLGHSHPAIIHAIREQAGRHLHLLVYGELIQAPQVHLAGRLAGILPRQLDTIYFVNSGAEAVEGALKLAKRYTGRHEIIAMKNAYHGSTHGALSATGNEDLKRAYRPLVPGFRHIELNNQKDLGVISSKTAAVILEPVMGEAGVRPANPAWIRELRSRCNETGSLLIFDEIQTGFGRTGSLFAFEKLGIVPDILLLAKALGGGMPLGAFIASSEIMNVISHSPALGHITTFGGHPVSCAAALAHLNELLSSEIIAEVPAKEQLFRKLLVHPMIREIRSAGLLMAIELGSAVLVQKVIARTLERGILLDWFLFCDTALRLAPPLIISEEEIKTACSILQEVLSEFS